MTVTQTPGQRGGLTKRIASTLTARGVHPGAVRAGSRLHLRLFRWFRGAGFLGTDTLVLSTTGRRSRLPRSTPLYYVQNEGRYYVAASFAGRDTPPGWYLNLRANPAAVVQIRGQRLPCRAQVLDGARADAIWPLLDATYRPFARYRQRTRRTIPVIELRPAASGGGGS